jgi:hypothetical protein
MRWQGALALPSSRNRQSHNFVCTTMPSTSRIAEHLQAYIDLREGLEGETAGPSPHYRHPASPLHHCLRLSKRYAYIFDQLAFSHSTRGLGQETAGQEHPAVVTFTSTAIDRCFHLLSLTFWPTTHAFFQYTRGWYTGLQSPIALSSSHLFQPPTTTVSPLSPCHLHGAVHGRCFYQDTRR